MRALLRDMLSLAERGEPFAVCTVVDAEGSVPGKVGATMVVTPDGRARGTVGGAGLEEKVRQAALDALRGERGGVRRYDLANWKPGGLDSVCGGTVDVSVVVHRPVPHLLLFGGGHCGKALADLAALVDWDVSIADARPEYANTERFPNAVWVHGGDPVGWAKTEPLDQFSHIYLLGHSWELDAEILATVVPRFDGFIGVIGSQAKRHALFERLRQQGIPADRLARIQCPIGVDIGAETPEEIAVAVAAEVVSTLKKSLERPVEVRR